MTVHRNRFLVNKTNRCTKLQFYCYYYSTCFGQPFCPSSGVLSRTSVLVHFVQLWWPFVTSSKLERISILLLVKKHQSNHCLYKLAIYYNNPNIFQPNGRHQRAVLPRHVCTILYILLLLLLLVFSPWASLGRNQSPVRRHVWLWYAASWASSWG